MILFGSRKSKSNARKEQVPLTGEVHDSLCAKTELKLAEKTLVLE